LSDTFTKTEQPDEFERLREAKEEFRRKKKEEYSYFNDKKYMAFAMMKILLLDGFQKQLYNETLEINFREIFPDEFLSIFTMFDKEGRTARNLHPEQMIIRITKGNNPPYNDFIDRIYPAIKKKAIFSQRQIPESPLNYLNLTEIIGNDILNLIDAGKRPTPSNILREYLNHFGNFDLEQFAEIRERIQLQIEILTDFKNVLTSKSSLSLDEIGTILNVNDSLIFQYKIGQKELIDILEIVIRGIQDLLKPDVQSKFQYRRFSGIIGKSIIEFLNNGKEITTDSIIKNSLQYFIDLKEEDEQETRERLLPYYKAFSDFYTNPENKNNFFPDDINFILSLDESTTDSLKISRDEIFEIYEGLIKGINELLNEK